MKLKFLLFSLLFFAVFYVSSQNANALSCEKDADCFGCDYCKITGLFSKECAPLPNENDPSWTPHVYTDPCQEISQTFCYQDITSDSIDVWKGSQSCPFATGGYKHCQGSEWMADKCIGSKPFCFENGEDTKCVECLSTPDCKGDNKICNRNHECVDKGCSNCPDGTKCGACSASTPGQFCKDNGQGTGVLEPSVKCPLCAKYDYAGRATGTGSHPKSPEICYDTVAGGKFTKYVVETCKTSGSVNEQECEDTDANGQVDTCVSKPTVCSSGDSCFSKNYDVDLLTGGGKKSLVFGYCDSGPPPTPKSEPNELPKPCGGNPVCGEVCSGQCVPGEAPLKYTAACGKVADCAKCGCPPSDYPGATVTCNAGTGLCSYVSPPGLPGEPPDCTLTTPDFEYNKTIVTTSTYLLSGNNLGTFSGYKWNGAQWQADSINTGLAEASYSSPAVFFDGGNTYLVSGRGDGTFGGYSWGGAKWNINSAANSGLTNVGSNSKPSIFYMNGAWNMIAGNTNGEFSGFTYSGAGWVSNASIVNNLSDVGDNSAPSVFYKDGIYYMISGEKTGIFYGFYWNGSDWLSDDSIISGLTDTGDNSAPAVFYNSTDLYLVTGKETGGFSGYKWGGTSWQADGTMAAGLSAINSRSAPLRLAIDLISIKSMTYSTRFPLESMYEYPGAGSDCYQNKTQIIIPEGHACAMNIFANSTAGWGVRLKTTTIPGKALTQDPFNVCGYIDENLGSMCYPDAPGNPGTPKCIVNQTPVLAAGTYEFGIVSSTGIANNKVSKACAYITQCADCENPYAQYYCNLCVNDRCSDKLQDCGEVCVDGGGSCQIGSETDNTYIPEFQYTPGPGLINTLLFGSGMGGLKCVDGADNDHDCLTDCQDDDCDGSTVCSIDIIPPETTISFNPPEPNTKGWYLSEVKVTLKCTDFGKGCAETKYRIDNGGWVAGIGTLPVYFTLLSDGMHTVEYYSIDKVNNVEAAKSSIVKVYISPPFALIAGAEKLIVPVGSHGQLLITVKNLMNSKDTIALALEGLPSSKLHKWIWFLGHKEDSERYKLSLDLLPGEERIVSIDIFGGEVLSGGQVKVSAESGAMGAASEVSAGVDILYSDNGISVQTPEFGWIEFILVAVLGAGFI